MQGMLASRVARWLDDVEATRPTHVEVNPHPDHVASLEDTKRRVGFSVAFTAGLKEGCVTWETETRGRLRWEVLLPRHASPSSSSTQERYEELRAWLLRVARKVEALRFLRVMVLLNWVARVLEHPLMPHGMWDALCYGEETVMFALYFGARVRDVQARPHLSSLPGVRLDAPDALLADVAVQRVILPPSGDAWDDTAALAEAVRSVLRDEAAPPPNEDVLGIIASHLEVDCGVRLALAQRATTANAELRMRWARRRVEIIGADRWPLAWSQRVLDAHVGDIVAFERCADILCSFALFASWGIDGPLGDEPTWTRFPSSCAIFRANHPGVDLHTHLTLDPETMRVHVRGRRRRDPCVVIGNILMDPAIGTRPMRDIEADLRSLTLFRVCSAIECDTRIPPLVHVAIPVEGPMVCFNRRYPCVYEVDMNGMVLQHQERGTKECAIQSMLTYTSWEKREAAKKQPEAPVQILV